ncbi:MAG: CaiB/BaiF CoA-transferase family protein [Arenicellales bacterium]|nr:CaiB/BaiF CoA-transferase family protein [Arenicellales bacterium]
MSLLQGVTVVALEQAVAAPLASRHLADWGARVIKIERPGSGDFARHYDQTVHGLSSHFVWLNRSKQSLTLDVKTRAGKEVFSRLLEGADVYIQNLAPGAVDRLGFGAQRLRGDYPTLVVCNVSGYGDSGPYRDKKAYDLLVQAETGLLSITGTEESPSKAGISIADIAAGMYAYSGILAALLRRAQSGEGSVVDVSLFDALAEWMSYPAYFTGYGGTAPARTGAHHATISPYGPVTASDGRTVLIGLQNEREWATFCRHVLLREELIEDSRFRNNSVRNAHLTELEEVTAEVLARIDSEQLVKRLEAGGIAYGRMNTMQEFCEHAQLLARRRWIEIGSPAGPIRVLLPPVKVEGEDVFMGAVPDIGEHTDLILDSLGYSEREIKELRDSNVV